MSQASKLLRKITMSEVFGLPRKSGGFNPVRDFGAEMEMKEGKPTGVVLPFKPVLIARIVGVVRTQKDGQTDYGTYVEFGGNFGATNHKGETFRSPKCILPEPAQSLLSEALASAGEGNAVELAFDFHAEPDAGDRGYKFACTPLMQQPEDDPVTRLAALTNEKYALPALAAPAPAATPEPAADPAPADGGEKAAKKAK